jgi:hypothetical protein
VVLQFGGWAKGSLLTVKKTACYEMLHRTSELEGFCEHGNETSDSINSREFLDCMIISFSRRVLLHGVSLSFI